MLIISVLVGFIIPVMVVTVPEKVTALPIVKTYYPDATGILRYDWSWEGGQLYEYYYRNPGDPNLAKFIENDLSWGFEWRNYWRFNIQDDFSKKNVLNVELSFRTRDTECLSLDQYGFPICVGDLVFNTEIYSYYKNPLDQYITIEDLYKEIDKGIPYWNRPGYVELWDHTVQEFYHVTFDLNAIEDMSHHTGGLFAIGMKLHDIRDSDIPPKQVWGSIEICQLPYCSSQRSKDLGAGLRSAWPYLSVTYEDTQAWPQYHNNAWHNGYTIADAPDSQYDDINGDWFGATCVAVPMDCFHTDFSPVVKDGFVYTAVHTQTGGPVHIKRFYIDGSLPPVSDITTGIIFNEFEGGHSSLAVNKGILAIAGHRIGTPPYPQAILQVYSPDLTTVYGQALINAEISRSALTLYGNYILLGTEGAYTGVYGHLYLFEKYGNNIRFLWKFWPFENGDISTAPAVHKGKIIVRYSDTLYALPFVDPNGDGEIWSSEAIWIKQLTQIGGRYYPESGPAIAGDSVYIGDRHSWVYKLDIETGAIIQSVRLGLTDEYITSTPAVDISQGSVFVAVNKQYLGYEVTIYELDMNTLVTLGTSVPLIGFLSSGSAPTVADPTNPKLYLWVKDVDTQTGAWIAKYGLPISGQIPGYLLPVGTTQDAYIGEGITPAVADGWIFVGNGGRDSYQLTGPAVYSDGYIIAWRD